MGKRYDDGPKIEQLPKPIEKKFGGWVAMTFTAKRTYRGIDWYLTCFGERNDREDWIGDCVGLSPHVGRYRGEGGYDIFVKNKTWKEAADESIASSLDTAVRDLANTRRREAELIVSIATLQKAIA